MLHLIDECIAIHFVFPDGYCLDVSATRSLSRACTDDSFFTRVHTICHSSTCLQCLTAVVPFLGGHGGGGTPTWTGALPLISSYVERTYDDNYVRAEIYGYLRRFVEYGLSHTKNGGCVCACFCLCVFIC